MTPLVEDIFERPIKSGDFVVYGIRSGNSGGMRYGIVEEAPTAYNDAWGTGEQRVKVITFQRYSRSMKQFSTSRPSPDNMIVVADGTFPRDVEKALIAQYMASSEAKGL